MFIDTEEWKSESLSDLLKILHLWVAEWEENFGVWIPNSVSAETISSALFDLGKTVQKVKNKCWPEAPWAWFPGHAGPLLSE